MAQRPAEGTGPRALPALALVFNALVWGLSWWPLRGLQSLGLHPLWSTALVFGVSLALLLVVQREGWRPFLAHPGLWLLAIASGVTNVGFNWAVTIGDVVRVVLLFYLMPAWSVLLAWGLLGERPTPLRLLRLGVALAGVLLVLKTPDSPWPWPAGVADGLALLGGLAFALTNVLLFRLRATPSPARVLAMFGGGALMALATAAVGTTLGAINAPPVASAGLEGLLLALALSSAFLLGNLALQYGAARLPAHTTALVMLSEVVFASLSSVALGAAGLDARTLAGGALILASAAWAAWPERGDPSEDPT